MPGPPPHPVSLLPLPPEVFVRRLLELQARLRDATSAARRSSPESPEGRGGASEVVREGLPGEAYTGDTVYRLDLGAEATLLEWCQEWVAERGPGPGGPFVLVAEGLPGDGRRTFPAGADPAGAVFECIVDPVDGTRGLMYDKRSAWALAAIAPGAARLGRRPTLADVAVAVQSELPTSRARLADVLWAVSGQGAQMETIDLLSGERWPRRPSPSQATTLAHGFATISKFFPGTKEASAWLEERLFAAVVGEHAGGAPLVFDDEYISSGGQLYELLVGHDRFVADLRPVLLDAAARRQAPGAPAPRRLCARPYDLCTARIATEGGVTVTDAWGRPLAAPLDTVSDVAWVGYANPRLQEQIEPVLQRLLRELGAPEPP